MYKRNYNNIHTIQYIIIGLYYLVVIIFSVKDSCLPTPNKAHQREDIAQARVHLIPRGTKFISIFIIFRDAGTSVSVE